MSCQIDRSSATAVGTQEAYSMFIVQSYANFNATSLQYKDSHCHPA